MESLRFQIPLMWVRLRNCQQMVNDSTQRQLWSVPVKAEDIPETGRHFRLSTDGAIRAAIAAHAGLRSIEKLEASFEVTRRGRDGLRAIGEVNAVVGQSCVVTLEPINSVVSEPVDVSFVPLLPTASAGGIAAAPILSAADADDDPPELLVDGRIDLGALAIEFLILGIDPYPRGEGAKFVAPQVDVEDSSPFAALAKLKRRSDRGN
jgi:hypothetical protein